MKILSIVGPTGAGKTALALRYAHESSAASVHLISVDSRQVYQGLEIVSGADVPDTFSRVSAEHAREQGFDRAYYQHGKVYLHGVQAIAPTEEWSVAHFQQFAWSIISTLEAQTDADVLVICVGGTGLYHTALTQFDAQLHIKPNSGLRQRLEGVSVAELQLLLQQRSRQSYSRMTVSDQQNPRRLIRHLEIVEAEQSPDNIRQEVSPPECLVCAAADGGIPTIGITADLTKLRAGIKKRVIDRLERGAEKEVAAIGAIPGVSIQLLTATGVAEVLAYTTGVLSKAELIEQWTTREYHYAKRQVTWWKNKPLVHWQI